MMQFHKALATGFGIGYVRKGGGSVAAAVCCVVWYFSLSGGYSNTVLLAVTLAVVAVGIWCSTEVEPEWGIDSNRVVIDEIAGMGITLLFLPVKIPFIITGFILFRFFDIVKPLFIRRLEALPGGWGVMLDDVLAGIYANIILQVIYHAGLFGS
jgi:phosphatidylglycerophosphatase A